MTSWQSRRQPASALLGHRLDTRQRVEVADDYRCQHVWIMGKTGCGKTTLLENLILADLDSYTSAIVIDPHGDLAHRVISLAKPVQRERIVLLEQWGTFPFRLNLLECSDPADNVEIDRTVSSNLTLFKKLFTGPTSDPGFQPRLERYFGYALRTLIPNKGTLAQVPRLFRDSTFRKHMLAYVTNSHVHDFWDDYNDLPPKDRRTELESTINRLDVFLSSPIIRAMVNYAETTIPFDDVLNRDGCLLILRIPVGELRDYYASFYGALFLNVLTDHILARAKIAPKDRHRLHLYLDEYHRFATPTTASILEETRKYNLGATIAFQTLGKRLDEANQDAIRQVGTFILYQLTGTDADDLVSSFPVIRRIEWIEEEIGSRDELGPAQKSVELLTERGRHSNRDVARATDEFLRPLTDAVKTEEELRKAPPRGYINPSKLDAVGRKRYDYEQRVRGTTDAKERINQLLAIVNQDHHDLRQHYLAEKAADVFAMLWRYYEFPFRPLGPDVTDSIEGLNGCVAFKAAFIEYLTRAAQTEDPSTYPTAGPLQALYDEIDRVQIERNEYYGPKPPYDRTEEAYKRLLPDAIHLILLCRVFARDPFLVSTGRKVHETRKKGVPLSYADARTELAGILATLPRFTAYYQTPESKREEPDSYGLLQLTPPIKPDFYDEQAIQEVRERSRNRYGVPIDQRPPDDPLPPPRIGRRPPGS